MNIIYRLEEIISEADGVQPAFEINVKDLYKLRRALWDEWVKDKNPFTKPPVNTYPGYKDYFCDCEIIPSFDAPEGIIIWR